MGSENILLLINEDYQLFVPVLRHHHFMFGEYWSISFGCLYLSGIRNSCEIITSPMHCFDNEHRLRSDGSNWEEGVCTHCKCSQGHRKCATQTCTLNCRREEAIQKPGECCPTCPNPQACFDLKTKQTLSNGKRVFFIYLFLYIMVWEYRMRIVNLKKPKDAIYGVHVKPKDAIYGVYVKTERHHMAFT